MVHLMTPVDWLYSPYFLSICREMTTFELLLELPPPSTLMLTLLLTLDSPVALLLSPGVAV